MQFTCGIHTINSSRYQYACMFVA